MPENETSLPERVFVSPEANGNATGDASADANLPRLFRLIDRAEDVKSLKTSFIEAAIAHFAATRGALMLFDDFPLDKIPPKVMANPVIAYLLERHAPVHEGVVMQPGRWEAFCTRNDHGHVLTGPIVRGGKLIGALALTRAQGEPAFDAASLADASALCLHLSAWFSRWNAEESLSDDALTPRERQISELVAQGLTNAQIGEQLYISAETVKAALKLIFRKTGVSSRAHLAAKLRT